MADVPKIDVAKIFEKHAGRKLKVKPYVNPGLEPKKPKKKDI